MVLRCLLLLLVGVQPVFASNTTFTTTFENDSFFPEDQNYTGGLFLSLDFADYNWFDSLQGAAPPDGLGADARPAWEGIKLGISQMIWTPQYLGMTQPMPEDRPYSGVLSFDFGGYRMSETYAQKVSLHLGVTGPNSGADSVQQFIHDMLDHTYPQGWHTQTAHSLVVDVDAEYQKRVFRYKNIFDITLGANLRLGTFWRNAGTAVMLRFSHHLDTTTGTQGWDKGKYIDAAGLTSAKGGFVFLFAEMHRQFYDQTIQGTRDDSASSVTLRKDRYSMGGGAVWFRPNWGLSASVIYSVPDYREDWNDRYIFGSLTLFWRQHDSRG